MKIIVTANKQQQAGQKFPLPQAELITGATGSILGINIDGAIYLISSAEIIQAIVTAEQAVKASEADDEVTVVS